MGSENSEHIRIAVEDGHVVVTINDSELFDYVDDFLTEEGDIKYEYITESQAGPQNLFSLHFSRAVSLEHVSAAIAKLPADEIERIWRLNNTV